jgi:parallel beta-helix repeat protein
MLPIDEVDPRRPIYPDMLPLVITDDATSWYLARGVHDNSLTGPIIDVQAIGVTIDLMGFTLWTGSGPSIVSNHEGTTVQNGFIVCGGKGVDLASSAIVRNLAVNAIGNGIEVGDHSMVIDSRAKGSSGHGIIVGAGSVVRGCISNENAENGIWVQGMYTGEQGGLVVDSVVFHNGKNGIRVDGDVLVRNNECRGNDSDDSEGKAGIWVNGDRARVEGNHVSMNDIGIDVDGSNNIIVKNTVIGSVTSSFDIAPGTINNFVPTYNAGAAGTPFSWDNFCLGPGCI